MCQLSVQDTILKKDPNPHIVTIEQAKKWEQGYYSSPDSVINLLCGLANTFTSEYINKIRNLDKMTFAPAFSLALKVEMSQKEKNSLSTITMNVGSKSILAYKKPKL